MKARFLALAALVLGLASCQNDFEAGNAVAGGEVDFQLSVAAPELVGTRAGDAADAQQNAMDSAFGAIDYLQGAAAGDDRQDWEEDADLRYVLEVYDYKEDGNYDGAEPVKDRMVIIKDSYEPVVFNLRLAPNRKYHFVVFADFVEEGSAELTPAEQLGVNGLRHQIGTTLANIEVINETINDEVADAYFATKKIEVTNVAAYDDIELKRPYGKLRVIATDLAELNLNVHPAEVVVEYDAYNPKTFNAVTGAISGEYVQESFTTNFVEKVRDNMDKHFYTVGYDAETTQNLKGDEERHSHITLFTDYILAEDAQKPIHFTMTVNDGVGNLIKETAFNTEIPIQRNYLTTVIGNVLTTATEVEITINDNFAGEYFNLWDGLSSTMPEYVDAEKTYLIREASELTWVADQVNGTTRATAHTFEGYTIKLVKDIHLNGERWQPIGATGTFKGTFDGNDHTIEGLFVSAEGEAAAGLFANCIGTIKNLTVVNSQVYGHWHAGIIVGYGICSRIEGCTVDNCVVVSTPYKMNNGNNVGAIVGYLSAEPTAYVKGCTVTNTKVTGYRKVGGIVGAANLASEVTGNYIESSYITADMTAEYSEDKPADAGRIIGWKHANVKDENNTYAGQNTTVANDLAVRVIVMPKADKIADYINNSEEFIVILPDGTYSFTADVEENKTLQANGTNVTLNVDGHKLNLGDASNYGLIAKMGAEVVVNDANIVSGGGAISAVNGSKVTVNGGSAYIDSSSSSGRYIFYAEGEGSVITVNGGSYSWDPSDNQKRAYVYCYPGAKVIINDGTFGKASTRSGYTDGILGDGETIIYGGTFGFNPTRWVAPGCTVTKEGSNWVVKAPVVVEDPAGLADAIANAEEGSTIALKDNVDYGTVTVEELTGVTIEGGENTTMRFVTEADSKIKDVTLKNVDFEFVTGAGQTGGAFVVINKDAEIENLLIEGCTIVGDTNKNSYGIYGQNPNATITVKKCTFSNLGYAIQAISAGGYKALTVEECKFEGIVSWAIMPQYGSYAGDLTITGCTFDNTNGGLIKSGALTADHTFTFTNNVITNSTGHDGKDSKWFEFNTSAGTAVVSGNTKDGAAWTPGTAEGLK